MESGLFPGAVHVPVVADSLKNNISRTEAKLSFSPSLGYRASSGFHLNLFLPVDYLLLDRKDEVRQVKQNGGHLLFSPYLWFQYPFSARLKVYSKISFSNNIGTVDEDYRGYILNTYRSLNRSDGLLSKNNRTSANLDFEYRNPFTTLFTSLHLFYDNIWRNMLYDVSYDGLLSSSTGILHPNTSHNFSIDYSLGKSIDAINSEVKVFASYNKNFAVAMNQGVISNYTSDSYSISPYISTDISRKVIFKYGASYRCSLNKIRNSTLDPVNYFTQDISTAFIPFKKLTFSVSFNHYFNDMIESSSRSSWFGNVGVRYKMKDVDWMLDWTNIFNTRQFVTYSYNDISSYYSVYGLRPAEVLLRIRFKIL